ncbi:MAG: hypothetical protein IKT86_05790, partial [Bacteroidaceae bacterium]|nr:hypothetical protein [Bacteroidaceae bacterium]
GTTYYYCAYAIVNGEEKRGEVLSFTTEQGEGNAYEAVDLGLSVMWATYNVGATSPEGYGDYFAWGETQTKSSYYESNSITYGLSDAELESRGIIDAYGNLTPAYDAATVNWGSDWRMPTYDEFEELIDNSTVEWTYVNGMYGYNVKSNINGNSIFLPANGYYDQDLLDGSGAYGFYWAATNYSDSEDDVKGACCLFFYSGLCGYDYYNERNCGQAVRPVTSGISKPEVTIATGEATDVTAYGAILSGTVRGTDEAITCGIIYGTSSDLSLNDYREETSANSTYSVSISNLQPGTTYYYCAYVVVDGEYKYGETYSFTTEQASGTGEYEAVDLGLSVKWATFNVGATSPEQYGNYFAWGETVIKDNYSADNSVTYGLSISELESRGIIGADGNLTSAYDAATVNWGSDWRMPTKAEQDELRTNCTWIWTTQNGVDGYKVTGPNGNFIFLPVAGYRYNTSLYYAGSNGYYWSATPYSDSNYAYFLCFNSEFYDYGLNGRYYGQAVRPVYSEASQPVVTIETGEATDVTAYGAKLSGTVSGTDETITCGVIYGTSSDLSLNDYREETSANGTYSVSISNLQPGTTYYYRAYVVVDGEYKYGETYSFTTEQASGTGEYEAVDLGLSVKWASFNVGATSPEQYGDYFAWGETGEKWYYVESTSDTYGLYFSELQSQGFIDTNGNLTSSKDAATVNWGSDWRMPTSTEMQELINNCRWEWTTRYGVYGYKITGPNGNSIFLPASGYYYSSSLYSAGSLGLYWSATPDSYSSSAYNLYFNSSSVFEDCDIRYYGRTVRPVYSEASQPVVTIETGEATDVTAYGATLSGTVSGTDEYVTCGFIYGTSSDLSLNDYREETSANGTYSVSISYLQPSTTYYYRAYVYVDGEYKYGETYSFTTEQESGTGEYEAVDLGLSVKWASFNVGATSPEQYGDYFAWGETVTKESYYSTNSVTYGLSTSELESQGIIDANGNLTAAYDAATANWGSEWRMPTLDEMEELVDGCTWEWTTQNGVNGYKVKSRTNGNSIFLPTAGCRNVTSLYGAGSYGNYLSATPYSNSYRAYDLYFYSSYYDRGSYYRDYGLTVRPVYSEASQPVVTIETGEATDITTDGATLNGTVSGTDEYVTCGVIYGTSSDLSFNDYYIETSANGTYSVSISNLQPGTTYYYCAYVYVDGEYKYGETYSFTTEQASGTGEYEAVDLGLSVKWATFNVGATSPEEYGDYFAWGETVTKESYTSSNSVTYGLSNSVLKSRGIIDANDNLTAAYDAATANWGGSWRMPTLDEIKELKDECTWEWTTQNEVYGRLVTGPNGNSIFLPAAGIRRNALLDYVDSSGFYLSATTPIYNDASYYCAYRFYFDSDDYDWDSHYRYFGQAVRPVSE